MVAIVLMLQVYNFENKKQTVFHAVNMLYNIKLFDLIEYCKLSNINWKISIYFVSRNNAKLIFLSQAS